MDKYRLLMFIPILDILVFIISVYMMIFNSACHNPAIAACGDIQLNHYFTRSREEIQKKILSGRADRPGAPRGAKARRTQKIWDLIEQNTVEDLKIQRFLPLDDVNIGNIHHEKSTAN